MGIFCLVNMVWVKPKVERFHSSKEKPISVKTIDYCLRTFGGIELTYENGSTTSFTFDLYGVIDCGGDDSSWKDYHIYLCADHALNSMCEQNKYWSESWCDSWSSVVKYAGLWVPDVQREKGYEAVWKKQNQLQRYFSPTKNPVTLSLNWGNVPVGGGKDVFFI